MSQVSSTDCLVIGAGPTGLTLALELSLQNIPFRILELTASRLPHSRAFVMHSRTLELLRRHGAIQRFIDRGLFNPGIRIFAHKKFVHEIDLTDLGFDDTEFPIPLMISQADTERILGEILLQRGIKVERPVTVESVDDDGLKVISHLRDSNGNEEVVGSKYIIGCDGSHSFVRKSAGMKFQGGTYPEDLILADVELRWEQKRLVSTFMGAYGFIAVFPLPDNLYRVVCTQSIHSNNEAPPTVANFEEALELLVPGKSEIGRVAWMTRFRLHHRNVLDYRKGRIFVCGDAAHIHSPAGGQGMNTGIQDAVNLGWKLAMVLRGSKDQSFLDSYNSERHRVGENLLKGTDRIFETMATSNRVLIWMRNTLVPWVVPFIFSTRERRARWFRFLSQLGIRYRHSSIVGTGSSYKGKLRGGDRAPDGELRIGEETTRLYHLCDGSMHHLVLFSGVNDHGAENINAFLVKCLEGKKDWVDVHKISDRKLLGEGWFIDSKGVLHDRFGLQDGGYVLVRPDGYMAHIGMLDDIDELMALVSM